jgi:hypothetical protein
MAIPTKLFVLGQSFTCQINQAATSEFGETDIFLRRNWTALGG